MWQFALKQVSGHEERVVFRAASNGGLASERWWRREPGPRASVLFAPFLADRMPHSRFRTAAAAPRATLGRFGSPRWLRPRMNR